MSDLANQPQHKPLEKAVEIIERFGGIRPMATKTGVAVTTIQGWKKRGVIPANRVDSILNIAKVHNINIAEFLDVSAANAVSEKIVRLSEEKEVDVRENIAGPAPRHDDTYERIKAESERLKQASVQKVQSPKENYTEYRAENTPQGIPKTLFVSLAAMALLGAGVIGFLIPKGQNSSNLEAENLVLPVIESKTASTDGEMFKGFVPEGWSEQLESMGEDAVRTAENVGKAVQDVSEDLMGEDAGTTQQRLVKLEKYANNIAGQDLFSGLTDRFASMSESFTGRDYLDQSMSALHGMVMGESSEQLSDEELNLKLDAARKNNSYLSETFTGVPTEELKAAGMLLAMTQMRESLNRSNVPFEKDMETLLGMVGKDDVELRAALAKLAPSAKQGILTPKGLSDEFRTMAGDAVSASLNGEDVSMVEKARARMNQIFQVEKGGELVSGTKTQAIIAKAQKDIDAGNIQTAVDFLKDQLRAKELEPLRPWINRAEAALSAPDVKQAIERAINMQTIGSSSGSGGLKKTRSDN